MSKPTPYDREPWHRKVTLWFRYMPVAYVMATFRVSRWVAAGCKPLAFGGDLYPAWILSRPASAAFIWHCTVRPADMRMGKYYTAEEVLGDLKAEASDE